MIGFQLLYLQVDIARAYGRKDTGQPLSHYKLYHPNRNNVVMRREGEDA
jgi:hypothetical protein